MPILFNSKLSSTVANQTWLDKTQDDSTVGKLNLNESNSTAVNDAQLQINKNKKLVFGQASKTPGDTITLDNEAMVQEHRLIGNGAPIVMDSLPFGNSQIAIDGTEIILVGHDDTFTVSFELNDSQYGLLLNGNATLQRGNILRLVYNDELERYIEIGRNF